MNSVYYNQILLFINTKNTIEIKDKEEFTIFIQALEETGYLNEVLPKQEARNYEYWQNLVYLNSKGQYDLVFEFDTNKGITFYTDRQISINWYQKEPLRLPEVDKEKICKFCKTEHVPFILTTIEASNDKYKVCPNCFARYLDEIIKAETIHHKCDCCNSHDVLQITTSFATYYLCKEHLIDFACYNLDKQSFKALYTTDTKGNCDFYLHDDFYFEDGIALQPNDEYAKELKEMLYCDELCPNCDNEVKIPNDRISLCPNCHTQIKPCSMCDMDSVECNHCKFDK